MTSKGRSRAAQHRDTPPSSVILSLSKGGETCLKARASAEDPNPGLLDGGHEVARKQFLVAQVHASPEALLEIRLRLSDIERGQPKTWPKPRQKIDVPGMRLPNRYAAEEPERVNPSSPQLGLYILQHAHDFVSNAKLVVWNVPFGSAFAGRGSHLGTIPRKAPR